MYIKASYISALRISLGLAFFVSALFKGLNMFSTAMNIQSYADALKFDFSLPYYEPFGNIPYGGLVSACCENIFISVGLIFLSADFLGVL